MNSPYMKHILRPDSELKIEGELWRPKHQFDNLHLGPLYIDVISV